MKTATAGLMFALNEVAELCGLTVPQLRDWVELNYVTPAKRGSKGRGHQHRFTAQQVLGITVGSWFYLELPTGCSLDFFKRKVATYSAWTWAQLEDYLELYRTDDLYREEAVAKAAEEYGIKRLRLEDFSVEMQEKLMRLVDRQLELRQAIIEKLDPGSRIRGLFD